MGAPNIKETDFLSLVAREASHLMWFLGAGTSRSSGLPTASDITWNLKRNIYCLEQNQDIARHDWGNKAVQARIQSYMDGKGYPALWETREYSFYFEKTFGFDYAAQQSYFRDALATSKLSLTIGPRALAGIMAMGRTPVAFTTNFDEVIESAYAAVAGKNLSTFHLEGPCAALAALNASQFPFYAKVHGDFRFKSVKNLEADLLSNDLEIQKCFLAAATRFGMVVAGYSGRDENVMGMFRQAVDQNNAFPHGLFWAVPGASRVSTSVHDLLAYANSKGIRCGIVEIGTFDEMMSKIWKSIDDRPPELDAKVRSAFAAPVTITLPPSGTQFPMVRTNGLHVTKVPEACGTADCGGDIDMGAIRSKLFETRADCTIAHTDRLLFWGSVADVSKVAETAQVGAAKSFPLDDSLNGVIQSGALKGFVEEALARAVVQGKPIFLRKAGRTWFAVVDHGHATDEIYKPLRLAIGKGTLAAVCGKVFGLTDVFWAEAVALHLEERNGSLWLMLQPDIWISPLAERESAKDFFRERGLRRYNAQSFDILSAWISILVGDLSKGRGTLTAFPDKDFKATFEVSTRTAYSRRSA